MFKPIRDELPARSPAPDGLERVPVEEEETDLFGKAFKNEKETKRRQSLPCFEPAEQEMTTCKPVQNVGETYDVSYYSSYCKERKDFSKTEYYSGFPEESGLRSGEAKLFGGLAVKSVSDECVYEGKDSGIYSKSTSLSAACSDKTTKTSQDFYFGEVEPSKYRRISVTEPSSPAENPFLDYSPSLPSPGSVNEPEGRGSDPKGNGESDFSDAESEPDEETVTRMKKSKSFVDAKEDGVLQMKKFKSSKSKTRKSSASSTSSYDSACRFHGKTSSEKFASESENATPSKSRSLKKSGSCLKKCENVKCEPRRRQKTKERLDQSQKFGRFSTFDRPSRGKPSDVRKTSLGETETLHPAQRERAKSWNREPDNKQSFPRSEIDPDLYLYLLEVLTRKSRKELEEEKDEEREFFTKSLPRNHRSRFQKQRHEESPSSEISRHLSSAMKCEKDCLKILKSVSKEKPEEEISRSKNKTDYNKEVVSLGIPRSEIEIVSVSTPARNLTYQPLKQRPQERKGFPLIKSSFEEPEPEPETYLKKRSASRERFKEEECVLRIEDGNLWIEICKAIQETESKNRKLKKNVYKT